MKEKFSINYTYCLTEEDDSQQEANLKLTNGMFHSSFTFTGIQFSYMINCRNGLIAKINMNQDEQEEQKEFKMFNKSLAPTIAIEEQNYPRGKYPFKKAKNQKKGLSTGTAEEQARKHIDRELFIGHRYKVIWIGFLEGGSTLVTLDVRGYLYIWVYEKASFTSDLHFKPTIKLKLEINSAKFLLESSTRIFPEGKEKDINPKSMNFNPATLDKIRTFMSRINVPEMKEKSVTVVKNDK